MGWREQERFRGIPTTRSGQIWIPVLSAQQGLHPPSAKPLKGPAGGLVELIDDFDGDAYRAVYTVRFETAVYVLHAFKKKSKQGIKTPQRDIALIQRRLRDAEMLDQASRRERQK